MMIKTYVSIRKNPLTSLKLWMTLLLFLSVMNGWAIAAVKEATSTTPFTIAVIPDSQYMVSGSKDGSPTMFNNQVKWIMDNVRTLNIKFVTHVGDLVNTSDKSSQWTAGSHAMYQLDGAVPYAIAPGNHDTSSGDGDFNTFNTYFPVSKFSGFSWYGDGYNNRNHNSYQLFSTNGMDFIIIHMAFHPSSAMLSWASQILDYYPNHRAIISTHRFLDKDGINPNSKDIWSDVINKHNNVFMVVCGHEHSQRMFVYKNNSGNNVYCLLTDYQDDDPQIAKLRYYTFKPGENAVYAYTYATHKKNVPFFIFYGNPARHGA